MGGWDLLIFCIFVVYLGCGSSLLHSFSIDMSTSPGRSQARVIAIIHQKGGRGEKPFGGAKTPPLPHVHDQIYVTPDSLSLSRRLSTSSDRCVGPCVVANQ